MQIRPSTPHSDSSSQTAASVISDEVVAVSLSSDPETQEVLITLTPPSKPASSEKSEGRRAPLDICCVIDVSSSMSSEASIPADPATGRPAESNGLSVLDIVKHSLRTIVTTMQEDDRIALVTFSDSAKTVLDLTKMDEAGKANVRSIIESLRTECLTNLWDGLKMGMTLLSDDAAASSKKTDNNSAGRLSTLFILTDGMPNIEPPRGHTAMLRAFLEAHPMAQPFSISTFGFGYSLDSQLLLELGQIGGGGYGFIPDAGMVGTVFIHAVANAYSTYAPRARLDIEFPPETPAEVKGALPVIKTSWGIQIDAGDMQFGQDRDFVVVVPESHANISVTLTYRPFGSVEDVKVQAVHSATSDLASIKYHAARLDFVDALLAVKETNSLPASVQALTALKDRFSAPSVLATHKDGMALARDISGEGLLALEKDNFSRWGRHYLPSLGRAHQRQQCGNFKDPGLQLYGRDSTVFQTERDKLDAAFDALPPPKPSLVMHSPSSPGGHSKSKKKKGGYGGFMANFGGASATTLSTMSMYNKSVGPCFDGGCTVKVRGGADVRVEQLKRGMVIETMGGPREVAAVVRTRVPSGEALLCRIGDLKVTPWHPIMVLDKWVFPADVVTPDVTPCEAVYSVLLLPDSVSSEGHTVCVAGVWCVTLGHGITSSASGDVRAHAFLGDYEKVVRDLSALGGFYGVDGVVACSGTRRSGVDRRVSGFVGEDDSEGALDRDIVGRSVAGVLGCA